MTAFGMGLPLYAVLFGAGVAAAYAIIVYNSLVWLGHAATKAWANIDVLLRQRRDEAAALVDVCRAHAGFERETLQAVLAARRADADQPAEAADEAALLLPALHALFAAAEAYPDLKASRSFLHLQKRLSTLESELADRRTFYNESVAAYNARLDAFPDLLFARLAGMKPKPFFTLP
jgi:LemA protein